MINNHGRHAPVSVADNGLVFGPLPLLHPGPTTTQPLCLRATRPPAQRLPRKLSYTRQEDRVALLGAMEKFLTKYNPAE